MHTIRGVSRTDTPARGKSYDDARLRSSDWTRSITS
jgi:hypothetical protein